MSANEKAIIKSYMLYPDHVAVISQMAKDGGKSSHSAGLRRIIDQYVQLSLVTKLIEALNAGIVKEGEALEQLAILVDRNGFGSHSSV